MYKEHMHPQKLLCPITYTYVPLTKELKAKIVEKKFIQLNEEAEEAKHNNIKKLFEFINNFKVVFERDRWLKITEIRKDMIEKFTMQLSSLHKIMGDIFIERFLFDYL